MKISIDIDSIRISSSEYSTQLFSSIYLDMENGRFFPEKGWDDFAVVVLNWWIDEGLKFLRTKQEAKFRFMDGDFFWTLTPIDSLHAACRLFENSRNVSEMTIASFPALKSLLQCTNTLLRKCKELSYAGEDFQKLSARHALLAAALKTKASQ